MVQPKGCDRRLCHLETPLGSPYSGYPLFQGPPQIAPALKQTGYDACSTASNHSFDKGAAGVDRTLNTLDQAGLRHMGTARTPTEAATPTIVEVQGVKVALLSYTYSFNGVPYPDGETWRAGKLDVPAMKAMAKKARDLGAEIVVISCHWGDEYSKSANPQQREIATELLADSNIDLVLGHHAHVVQPLEQLNGKWVVYGLGNLVAAHRSPGSTKSEGLLVRFTFRRSGDHWRAEAQYAPLLVTDTLPVRVLDVRRELAKPGLSAAQRARLELADRRTTQTVTSLGAAPKPL
jgi:poly-gamma-glutamate capsule biosynthesis protein CapA/YwtB (metallophosphatase superfamily)